MTATPDSHAVSTTDDILRWLDQIDAITAEQESLDNRKKELFADIAHAMAEITGKRGNFSLDVGGRRIKRTAVYRESWDKEKLVGHVMDSRLFDKASGELVEEAPIDKVLHVWNLGKPRVTALRDRGLDPDQFVASEFGYWRIDG